MTRVESGGGGGSVGIDPQLLQSMINAMNSSAGEALTLVNGYISQLTRVGLDTGSLARAVQDLTWAQDQVPMLNRRLSLARAMAEQNPGLVDVTAGAGALDFATNQAAQAAGKSDGTSALQALEERGNVDFILKDLQAHADDPAYMSAFFGALGPQGLTALGLQVTGYQQEGNQDQYREWAGTVGDSFAVATYQMPYKPDWISQLQPPGELAVDPAMPMLGVIQPFLSHGVYSASWLSPLGTYALEQAYIQGRAPGMEMPVQLDGIWTAISHNPAFDAQFYQQNFANGSRPDDSILAVMTNPMLIGSVDDSAFAAMVRSATIPPAGTASTGPFAANAQLTIRQFGSDPSLRTSDQVRAAFGAIVVTYFNDLAYTVRAAAPGVGAQDVPGLPVSAGQQDWATFMAEAMRDKTTAAELLTYYSSWARSQPHDSYPSEGGGPSVPLDQGFWNDASLGMLRDFMAHDYQLAGAPAGQSTGSIADIAAAGGSAILTSLVFGPEAGLGEILAEGGKDAFQAAAEADLNTVFSSGDPQPVNDPALQQLTGIQQNWSQIVSDWYNAGNRATATPYLNQSYNGDPATYISQFSNLGKNANFIQNGQIMNPAQMNPYQLAAFNEWLQDPAVVSANREEFISQGLGGLLSQYARSTSGG
jgi:hypothetical protein